MVILGKEAKLGEPRFHLSSDEGFSVQKQVLLSKRPPAPLPVPHGSENMVRSLPNLPSTELRARMCKEMKSVGRA